MLILLRDWLFTIIKKLDSAGVAQHASDAQWHCSDFIVSGPDYLWSINDHCKLDFFGIEIYADIDAYSQYITWIYIELFNHTAVSALVQFLTILKIENVHSQQIQSDHDIETALLAAAHHAFMKVHISDISFADCYQFETSTANQQIEAWWAQLTDEMLFWWWVCLMTAILIVIFLIII